jgi:hypothetical protein
VGGVDVRPWPDQPLCREPIQHRSLEVWAWFISVFAVGAKIVAFLIQYAVIRVMIRRGLRLAAIAKSSAAPLSP